MFNNVLALLCSQPAGRDLDFPAPGVAALAWHPRSCLLAVTKSLFQTVMEIREAANGSHVTVLTLNTGRHPTDRADIHLEAPKQA